MRTRWLGSVVSVVSILGLYACAAGQTGSISDQEVQRVHRSALLIDTHNDVPWSVVDGFDIGPKSSYWHTDLARLKEGGVGAVVFVAYVAGSYVEGNRSAHRAIEVIDAIHHDIVGKYSQDFSLATSADEIERAHRDGRIAALIGIEGGHAIEDSLRLLRDYYDLGVRYMTLTHSNTNNWADSSGDINRENVRHHEGLTDFGKDVVREMNRLGMIVDISHVADATFWDALDASRAPIFASHSSARALTPHARNLTDEMIAALAKAGGVVQVNFNCGFVSKRFADAQAVEGPRLEERFQQESAGKNLTEVQQDSLYARLRREMKLTRASLAELVDHIDHIRDVGGIDAVGIGSDFNGVTCTPEGLDDVSQFPNLTRALLERGYSEADIRKIYGGNFLRLMRAVEAKKGEVATKQ